MAPVTAPAPRKMQAANWERSYAPLKNIVVPAQAGTTPANVASRISSAERVGILDHIGSAAGGGARGEQHEARGHEAAGREITADGEIVGDVPVGRIAKSRQRDVRDEFAALGI